MKKIIKSWFGTHALGWMVTFLVLLVLITYFSRQRIKSKFKANASDSNYSSNDSSTRSYRREETNAKIGPKPKQNPRDGSVELVKDYIKSNSKNPTTIEFYEWSEVSQSGRFWKVRCKYSGISSFNAEVTTNSWFYIQRNKVVYAKIISKI